MPGNPRKRDFPSKQELDGALDTEVRIFVPSTYDINKRLSPLAFKKRIAETVNFFTNVFGGSTRFAGFGSYTSEKGVVTEQVAVIEVFATGEQWNRHDEQVKRWLQAKKRAWGQESMGFEWQGELIFV